MPPIHVRLNAEKLALCDRLADQRVGRNLAFGAKPRQGQPMERLREDAHTGCEGECAVGEAFGLLWPPNEDDFQDAHGDVGEMEVRATTWFERGRLPINQWDPPDRAFVLVRCRRPDYVIVGFWRPRWGLKREWFQVHREGGGSFFIPGDILRDPYELDPARRSFERRFDPDADRRAIEAGFVCAECGAAGDLRVQGELFCVDHRIGTP